MNEDKIDIASKDLSIVINILNRYVGQLEVRAFGSRINNNAKKFSDLDLAIMTENPLPLNILADITEAFSESELPIKVDVLDWSRISEEFRQLINHKYVRIK